jgi:quercetin dioxygenase-like cupin family protein
MLYARLEFLKGFGVTVAFPAILHAQTTAFLTQRKEFTKGPADWFTRTVRIDPLFQANAPARASGASVTFEPGARTVWHTHPLGQTLIVTSGCGWAQREGEPIEEIRPR